MKKEELRTEIFIKNQNKELNLQFETSKSSQLNNIKNLTTYI